MENLSIPNQDGGQQPGAQDVVRVSGPRVPIPRGDRARDRVLRAALEVLAEGGLPGFTVEAVAERAGASKATVYRHWRSRGELIVDAMDMTFQPLDPPRSGQLRSDLIELVSDAEALVSGHPFPRLMAAFIDAVERDPTLANLHVEITRRRREPVLHVLAEARQRGEIPATADLELAVDLLTSPLFYRRFISHQPFPPEYGTAVVDHVLTALGAAR